MKRIARTIVELSLTLSASGGGRTMLDDTVVWVFSEFGRTSPKFGSDHHPATCMMLAGNSIVGNQMIGGYDETMNVSPMGIPVNVTEESGAARKPNPERAGLCRHSARRVRTTAR